MPEVHEDENPFFDVPEPVLIGYAYYKLEGLSWMLDNPSTTSIISSTFEVFGKLNINVIPVDAEGNKDIPETMIPDEQEELLEKRLDFIVQIDDANDLPDDFCRDVYAQYSFFLDDEKFKTQKCKGKNQNPEFNYTMHHTVNCVTSLLLDHLKNDCLTVELYGYPETKKDNQYDKGISSHKSLGYKKRPAKQQNANMTTMSDLINSTADSNTSTFNTFNVVDEKYK